MKVTYQLRSIFLASLFGFLPLLAYSAETKPAPEVSATQPATANQQQTVNINQASAQELAAKLQGIGIKKAERIIEYRQQFGPFVALDQLTAISGISQRIVDKNRELMRLE